jgi:ribosome maturation factor RimP
MTIKDDITKAVTPVLDQNDMELVDLVVGKYRNKTLAQFFIDKNQGKITLDDCQKMSNIIGGILDMEEIIKGAYVLEVSSPGINRPLTKPEHFKKSIGTRAKIELKNPVNNQHNFAGSITNADESGFTLDDGTKKHEFKYEQLKKARLDPALDF